MKTYRVAHKVTVEYIRWIEANTAKEAEEMAADMGDTEGDEIQPIQTEWKAKLAYHRD